MNYKVLYRKYRPKDFDGIVGQKYIIQTLKNSILSNKISHAYIFSGPRGTGKTSTAKVFAKTINCLNRKNGVSCNECQNCLTYNDSPDIIEIDAASNNGINEIRELRNNINVLPTNSKYKIYIIDEFHMITTEAFNALLKTLEEPPSHVIFIMATTDIQKVPITILSRCQRFDFKKLDSKEIFNYLKFISEEENIKISDESLNEISLISDGGLRDALSILDQLNNNGKISIDDVNNLLGNVSHKIIKDIVESLILNNNKKLIDNIKILKENNTDYKIFIEKLLLYLKDEALKYKFELNNNLIFEKIKKLMYELTDKLDNLKLLTNPFNLIEIILLSYIDVDNKSQNITKIENEKINIEKQNDEKIISIEKVDEKVKINNIDENKDIENKMVEDDKIISREIISIRINNCFCKANKDKKIELNNFWNKFIEYIKENNKEFLSIILDTKIVAASDEYAIISTEDIIQANLINQKIIEIENLFEKFKNFKYKFIAITEKEFNKEKIIYANNIKKNIKYNMKEDLLKNNKEKEKKDKGSELENTVMDLFSKEIIEIK